MKIYLSGGMKETHTRREIVSWLRDEASDMFTLLDPADYADDTDPASYTSRDMAMIREADVVLALMESSNPSGYGLCFEVGYAVGLGKPVVFLDLVQGDWRKKYFDMIRQMGHTNTRLAGIRTFLTYHLTL